MIEPSERKTVDALIARLTETYPMVSPQHVVDAVHGAYARFAGRPLREFVPLFVERDATSALKALAGGAN